MIMLSQILYLYFLAIIFAFFYGDNYGWALSSIMAIINVLLLYSRNIKIQRYYCRSIAKLRRGIVNIFVRVMMAWPRHRLLILLYLTSSS